MRLRFPALAAGLTICLAFGATSSATAQSFFQKLFGFGGGEPQPQMRLGHPSLGRPENVERHAPSPRSWSDDQPVRSRRSSQAGEGGGKVQTLCVRMCDGYYFPISRSTSRRNLQLDAKACSARCGSEARLFVLTEDSDDKSEMTDLTGLAYGDTPNAFKYRKSLTPGCACRPDPWSEAELARHRAYAAAEAEQNGTAEPKAVADASPAPVLPPAVAGPGVVIMSADETVVASADEGASHQPENGSAADDTRNVGEPLVAAPAQPAPVASGPSVDVGPSQDLAENAAPPSAVAYIPRAGKASRHRSQRVALLNAGAVHPIERQASERQQRRRQQRSNGYAQPKAASYAVAGNGWNFGQAKYRYPGDVR